MATMSPPTSTHERKVTQPNADTYTLHSPFETLFRQRLAQRPKEVLVALGLPADHAPTAVTYQDLLPPPPPPPGLPFPIEHADRVALQASAAKGNAHAHLALDQWKQQAQQHMLSSAERSFLTQAFQDSLRLMAKEKSKKACQQRQGSLQ